MVLFLFWENIWPLRSFCVEELEIILAPNSVLLTGLFLTEYSYNCVILIEELLILALGSQAAGKDSLPISYEGAYVSAHD